MQVTQKDALAVAMKLMGGADKLGDRLTQGGAKGLGYRGTLEEMAVRQDADPLHAQAVDDAVHLVERHHMPGPHAVAHPRRARRIRCAHALRLRPATVSGGGGRRRARQEGQAPTHPCMA